jgi:hypothetical protein
MLSLLEQAHLSTHVLLPLWEWRQAFLDQELQVGGALVGRRRRCQHGLKVPCSLDETVDHHTIGQQVLVEEALDAGDHDASGLRMLDGALLECFCACPFYHRH